MRTSWRSMSWLLVFFVLAAGGCAAAPPASAPDPEPITLRLLTYNIKHGRGNDGIVDLERAARVIAELDPDLVALQEIDDENERTGRVAQAATLGALTGMHHAFGPFMDYRGGRYGMALLSKQPWTGVTNHRLPDGAEPRSALAGTVELEDGTPLTFIGIHFYATEAERMAQAERVIELYAETTTPVVLAGDFNSEPGSVVMDRIGAHWEVPPKDGDRLTFSSDAPRIEIDFFGLRPAGRFRVVESRVIDEPLVSDHRPVLLVVEWMPGAVR